MVKTTQIIREMALTGPNTTFIFWRAGAASRRAFPVELG